MDSLKNISQFNTGSTIANGMKLSESAVASYKAAIDGLSLSQAQAALSSTALTDAQKEQILVSAELLQSTEAITLEEVKQLASSASLSAQKKEEILTTLQGAFSENEWNREKLEAIANSGGEAGAIAQSILAKKAENAENIKGVASNKALTASLWAQLKARLALLAANPAAWIVGAIALGTGLVAIQKKLTKSLEECTEELDKNNSAFDEAQSEAESLQSEWETCQKRLAELQKLADNGTISIIEQEEYDRLLKTNDELERNIRIQKEKAQLSAIDAANSADETLSKTVESKYVTVDTQDSQGVEITQTAWITPKEELNASIEEYKRLQTEIDRLKVSYDNGSISAEDYNTQLTDLTNQQTDARNRASEMSDILVESEQAYTNLTNTGAELTTTQTANYNSVKQANEAYNDFLGTINGVDAAFENLDTTEKAQSLKNKYAQKTMSLPNGQGTYTVDDKEISDWVDTLSDEDLTVLASINFSGEQTKESMQEALDYAKNNVDGNTDKTSILSFSDAWEQLKNSTNDATKGLADELTKLAEAGQLTSEALSEADTTEFFKNAGISAEEAVKQINALVSSSTQLQSMSAQISKMSDMLADKKNGTTASASDLAGFDATVKGLESWDEFERVMGSSKSSMEECQQAANALATEWVNNGNFLSNLTDENKDYYITQLNNMGVMNAEEIVVSALAASTEYATLAIAHNSDEKNRNNQVTTDLTNATAEEIGQILNEGKVSDETREQLANLAVQKALVNGASLDTSGDIQALIELAGAATETGKILAQMQAIKEGSIKDSHAAEMELSRLEEKLKSYSGSHANLNTSVQIKPTGSSGYSAPKTGGSGSDSKQTIDWIERKLDVLQKKIDATKAKFENLFTLKDKKNNLNEQIKLTNSLLNTTNKAADKYLKAANGVKLSSDLKKKVRNGSYDINEYDDKTAKKIQEYQNYIDKYNELIKQADTLNTDIRNLKSERYQLYIDDADARTNRYETLIDSTASTGKRISYLKKSRKTIGTSYKNKIKQAINDGNYVEASTLRAEWKKALKDNTISQYQERADKADKKAAKSQALAALDEGNYKKQNKHLESQKKSLRESYNWQIKIAKKKGDTLEVARLQAEKEKELRDLTKEEFDDIVQTYEYRIGHIDNFIDDLSNSISDVENRGLIADSTFYTAQIDVHNKIKAQQEAELKDLKEQLKTIDELTPEWYQALESIQDVENSITSTNSAIKELQNSINEVANTLSGNVIDLFHDINDEADLLITLLGDNLADSEIGTLTDKGKAALGLYNQQMNVSKVTANNLLDEINSIQNAINNGTYGDFVDSNGMLRQFASTYEAENRIKELYSTYRSEIQSTYQYESKIIDLMKSKYDAELAYVKELIDKKTELLNTEKDLYDYSKNIKSQVDGITSLQKQIQALSGDLSNENTARIQRLEKQLKDQQSELRDTEYDRYVSDQQNMLDNLYSEYEKLVTSLEKDNDTLLKEGNQLIESNGSLIQETIKDTTSNYGYQMTEAMTSSVSNITEGLSGIKTVLDGIAEHVAAQIVDDENKPHDINAGGAKNDAISTILSNGDSTKPGSTLTRAVAEAYGGGLSLQEIADISRLLGLKYELKDFEKESPIHNQAKVDVLNELVNRGYLKKSGNKYLKGYAKGGVISSLSNAIRVNGDKVLLSANPGERILTAEQNENWEKCTKALPNLVNLTDVIKPNVNIPTAIDRNIGGVTYGGNNQINIEFPNVTNYEDFMRKFQNDPKAEQLVQHMTASALNGSRLGKNTIRF